MYVDIGHSAYFLKRFHILAGKIGVTLYFTVLYTQAYMVPNITNMEFLGKSNKNQNKEGKVICLT